MPDIESPRRRKIVAGVGAGLIAYSTGLGSTAADEHTVEEVQATLDNVGASAWEVTEIEGDDELAEIGVENPELTLREGVRYTFENDGQPSHPLAFRAEDGEELLTQSGDGSFEGDSETDWVDETETVSFTVTGELADQLDNYVCTAHSAMEGSIQTVEAQDDDAPAAVEFSDQSTDGTSVVVDSTRLDDGGFMTIHDSSLLDEEVIPSVIGVSEYLEPGTYENLEVELDDPISEGDTLIAMPHRDTNDNEQYDFVETEGDEDGPYTSDGDPVVDDADVQVEGDAATRINDQVTTGNSVVVDFTRVDDGGFMTIHDSSLLDGETIPSVIGVSDYLEPGTYDDLVVELDDPLEEEDTLIAMPHRDTNDNEEYDFVETEGNEDGPYVFDGDPVVDDALVQVAEATVNFGNQATGSSTITREGATTPGVAVDVTANTESAVVVTYEDDGELVIAGLGVFGPEELDGEESVVIPVEDAGGFPGEHVAHAIPTADLSGEYAPGDTVSDATAQAVVDNDGALVAQITLDFEDQESDQPVEEGEVMATVDVESNDGLGGQTPYVVDVHPTDADGGLVGPEFVGSTDVLVGDADDAEIIAERVPEDGEFNELPFVGTDAFVAMIHVVDDDAEAGDSVSPGSYPVLPNVDGEDGPVPGGVTDSAEITARDPEDDDDDVDDTDDDDMDDVDDDDVDDDDVDDADDADDDGPGFGPVAGVAGLGGLAAYAYKKLNLDAEPPTPDDENLDDESSR